MNNYKFIKINGEEFIASDIRAVGDIEIQTTWMFGCIRYRGVFRVHFYNGNILDVDCWSCWLERYILMFFPVWNFNEKKQALYDTTRKRIMQQRDSLICQLKYYLLEVGRLLWRLKVLKCLLTLVCVPLHFC